MSDPLPMPRLSGRMKTEPEDFVVEELPAYLPSGEGEHLFLWIEKRDVPAEQLLRHVARAPEKTPELAVAPYFFDPDARCGRTGQ